MFAAPAPPVGDEPDVDAAAAAAVAAGEAAGAAVALVDEAGAEDAAVLAVLSFSLEKAAPAAAQSAAAVADADPDALDGFHAQGFEPPAPPLPDPS